MIGRRDLLAAALALPGLSMLPDAARATAPHSPFAARAHPLGINLYMVAAEYGRDIDATFRALAAIGYREIETNFDAHPPEVIRAALDNTGLRCTNVLLLFTKFGRALSLADDPGKVGEAVHKVGAGHIGSSLFPLPPGRELRPTSGETVPQMLARVTGGITADEWRRIAERLNEMGAAFRRHGLRFVYHNHNPEFARYRESTALALLLEHTDPALVDFEMDAGWVVAGGGDPVAWLRAYPGRFRLMHVKDVAPASVVNTSLQVVTTEVGAGIVDWSRVVKAALTTGVRHFAVEQEPPYAIPPMEAAKRSFQYLAGLTIAR